MSLFCPRAECKAKTGMCTCEKIMAVVVLIVVAVLLYKHFA